MSTGRGSRVRLDGLDETKRPLYLVGLAVALPAVLAVMVGGWSQAGPGRVLHPALAVLVLVLGLGLLRRRLSVAAVEGTVLGLAALLLFLRLVAALYLDGDLGAARETVTGVIAPGATLLVVLLYLAVDARLGLRLSLGLAGAFALVTAPAGIAALGGDGASADALALLGMVVFVALVAVLLHVLATVGERVGGGGRRAGGPDPLAGTDPVTGIANRRRAEAVLAEELARAHRSGQPLGVALLDLDGFKRVNEAEGDASGDRALLAVIDGLQEDLRQTDTLARWDGDALVVIAPGTDIDAMEASAERWRADVADLGIPAGAGWLTVSIGVTARQPDDTLTDLLRRADAAVYLAKDDGRDRTVVS